MRGLRINKKTGRLREYESDIERRGDDYMATHGYRAISTKAESLLRAGKDGKGVKRAEIEPGHSDRVYVHPRRPAVYVEWKAPNTTTAPAHRLEQLHFILDRRREGYAAFICPDAHPDPWAVFVGWFEKEIKKA